MKHVRVSRGLDEVQACMDTVVHDLLSVDTVLLLQVRVKTRLDVLHNGSPTESCLVRDSFFSRQNVYLSSLLVKSPKPGVSTTVKCRRTPFSSMSLKT